jgi:hypothetical protein
MLPANTYVIRLATIDDEPALRRLAELEGQRPLSGGTLLIGEVDGRPAAATSLDDGRVVADPFQLTVQLRHVLVVRAGALRTYARTPSLPERLRKAIGTVPVARASAA